MRDQQGVQTLEVVQKFYEIINEPIRKAAMVKKDVIDFCEKEIHAVITLVREDRSGIYFHAVRVFKLHIEVTQLQKSSFFDQCDVHKNECAARHTLDVPGLTLGDPI